MKRLRKLYYLSILLLSLNNIKANYTDYCAPFECGTSWIQVDAGVYPTIWPNSCPIFLNSCECVTGRPVLRQVLCNPHDFKGLFKLPWILGGQLGYAWNNHAAVYGELNYIQAGGKRDYCNKNSNNNLSQFKINLDKYRAFSGYIGLRYYSNRYCDLVSLFIGAKVGFIYRGDFQSHAHPSHFKRDFFIHSARVSGGPNIGLDWKWTENWSGVLTFEVVASQGPKGNCNVPLLDAEIRELAGSYLHLRDVKHELSFPVTFGIKYNF